MHMKLSKSTLAFTPQKRLVWGWDNASIHIQRTLGFVLRCSLKNPNKREKKSTFRNACRGATETNFIAQLLSGPTMILFLFVVCVDVMFLEVFPRIYSWNSE